MTSPVEPEDGGQKKRGSKTAAVIGFVADRPGKKLSPAHVADSLCLDRKVASTLLSRLAREGRIMRVGRGQYSSLETDPDAEGGAMPGNDARSEKIASGEAAADILGPEVPGDEPEGIWSRIYEELTMEIERALGPGGGAIIGEATGRPDGYRDRTEDVVHRLRDDVGGRLALDMVRPILERYFGVNGADTAERLCRDGSDDL